MFPKLTRLPSKPNIILINAVILLLYFITGKMGLSLAFDNPSATAIWPPTGIALASLLLFGYRAAPAIFIGAFILNLNVTGLIPSSLGIALGNSLEAIVGAYLVKRFCSGTATFEKVSNIFKFVLLAGLVSTLVSSTIGTAVLYLSGLTDFPDVFSVWLTWWMGDMGGNMVIAPLLIVWGSHRHFRFNFKLFFNLFISLLGLLLASQLVFLNFLPFPYLIIPIGVWIAFWFGRRGATIAILMVGIIAAYYTLHQTGPFVSGISLNQSLMILQLFLTTFSITVLTFATLIFTLKDRERVITTHETRFKALIENSFDAVVLIDTTSKILYASPSVKRVLGYTPQDLAGMNGFDLVSPDDKTMAMQKLAELILKPGGTVTIQYKTIRKDNSIIWVEATGTNLLFEPNVNAVVVNFHDITANKNAGERILREKLTDEAMLTSIGDGVIATDNIGNITVINQAALDALGWERNEILHKKITDVIPMEDESGNPIPLNDRPITKVLSFGKEIVTSQTIFYLKKDKSKLAVQFTISPIMLDQKVVGTIEVFRDITKEKEIDRAKSEFVSIASHQLRTPLTIINWYLERLMKKGESFSEKDKNYLKEVYDASHRMVDLINSLLNVSRLELGTFVMEPKMVDIIKLVTEVLTDFTPQLEKKNIKVEKEFPIENTIISTDPRLMSIIFQNLISNSIKYNKDGGEIKIKITIDQNKLTIQVSDQGYGISQNEQSKIFTKLFRADNARSIDPDGTGLGLYIVKSIVTACGGEITFESEENKGTTFNVRFPMSGINIDLLREDKYT